MELRLVFVYTTLLITGTGSPSSGSRAANERASEPTRTERADEAARERACRGVRGAKPLGECLRSDPPLELIPLGGLGEFGMNMMVVACGDTAILIDAGVMFPEPELLGVDLIIPDLRQLQQYKLSALVLTHGHEDHIGAVPHVLPYFDGPVYGTALTLAFVESKLEEDDEASRARLRRGPAARSRAGRVVHGRVYPRDAQHAGLRGGRDRDAARA